MLLMKQAFSARQRRMTPTRATCSRRYAVPRVEIVALEESAFAVHSSYFLKLKWRSEIDYCEMTNQTYFEVKVSFERLLFYQFCFQLPVIKQLTLPSTYNGIDMSEWRNQSDQDAAFVIGH